MTELHRVLIQVEAETGEKLHTSTGVWIEKFISAAVEDANASGGFGGGGGYPQPPPPEGGRRPGPDMRDPRYARYLNLRGPATESAPPPEAAPTPAPKAASTNQIDSVTIVCRGVDLSATSASANTDIAFALEHALKESPFFDPAETQLAGDNAQDQTTGTFSFGVKLKLKRPLKLQ